MALSSPIVEGDDGDRVDEAMRREEGRSEGVLIFLTANFFRGHTFCLGLKLGTGSLGMKYLKRTSSGGESKYNF